MSYNLELYFRSLEFPEKEWLEILSWFDAIESSNSLEINRDLDHCGRVWFISVNRYGVFCALQGHYHNDLFKDGTAYWRVLIDTGSGFGLRQFLGYVVCYSVLNLISETSAWDCGQYFDSLYEKPNKFLSKVNAVINAHPVFKKRGNRLKMQQMRVIDENFQLIPDPHVLKSAAKSELYDVSS